MLRIRVKMGPARSKEWTCCFGLHVRTATIIIGLWHLFLNVMVLAILAVIIRHPQMIDNLEGNIDSTIGDSDIPALPTPLSKIDPPYPYRDHSLNYQNVDMGALACVCMIAITLLMIYGAVKGKPSHLLPFFCIQLFDFAITTLTAAGYICYLRSVHRLVNDTPKLPWREELLQLSPQTLGIIVLIAFVCMVLLKAYVIGIVWRCYKYLAMRQHNLRSMLPYIIPDVSTRQERDYSTLLPDYEEAIAQSMKQQPPPSYQVAMSSTPVIGVNGIVTSLPNDNNESGTIVAASGNSLPVTTVVLPSTSSSVVSLSPTRPSSIIIVNSNNTDNENVNNDKATTTINQPPPYTTLITNEDNIQTPKTISDTPPNSPRNITTALTAPTTTNTATSSPTNDLPK